MSTTSEARKTDFSDAFANFVTNLIVAIASALVKSFLAILYRIFLFFVVVISVSTVIALVAGGTTLFAVVFGKIIAAVFFLCAFAIVFALPARRFFDELSIAVKQVFVPQATPAV